MTKKLREFIQEGALSVEQLGENPDFGHLHNIRIPAYPQTTSIAAITPYASASHTPTFLLDHSLDWSTRRPLGAVEGWLRIMSYDTRSEQQFSAGREKEDNLLKRAEVGERLWREWAAQLRYA